MPGVAVNNIVANYSEANLDRASFIDIRNITEAYNNLTEVENSYEYETTTDSLSTIYDGTTETSTDPIRSTTLRIKRMNAKKISEANATTNEGDSKIILPIAKQNKYLWLPLTLLIAGAVFSHLGMKKRIKYTKIK